MKNFWILSLLVIGACGKVDMAADTKLEAIKISPRLVAGTELNAFSEICNALANKKNYIQSLKNSTYQFAGTKKECTDSAYTQLGDSTATLVEQYGELKFTEGVNSAYFSEVESIDSGAFADICASLSNLVSPISRDGINFVHFTTNVSSSDCAPVADQTCVKIEKGVKKTIDNEEMSDVHTREWIRVKLDKNYQTLVGFWSYKKRISTAGCASGYNFGRTATLK